MTNFETEINRSGYIVYTNKGDSMMPLLRQDKDLMVIRRIEAPLKKYDVVLFKRENGAYVLHRITKVCGLGVFMIGGDNRHYSEPIPEEQIIGIMTEVIRDGKHIPVTDPEYLKYVKRVPFTRFRLKLGYLPQRITGKLRRIAGKIKRMINGEK